MLEEKSHASIQQIEKITVCPLVVDELHLVRSTETGHSQQKLGKIPRVAQKQGGSGILQLSFFCKFQLLHKPLCRVGERCGGHSPAFHTKAHRPSNALLVQIRNGDVFADLAFPRIVLQPASHQPFLKNVARHDNRCAFHAQIGFPVVGIGHLTKRGSVQTYGNDLKPFAARNIDIFNREVDGWLKFGEFVGNFPACAFRNLLA